MSLDKAIESGKERRKQYRGSRAFSQSCRDNTCHHCLSNIKHKNKRREPVTDCSPYYPLAQSHLQL